jgi:hypothetical protein
LLDESKWFEDLISEFKEVFIEVRNRIRTMSSVGFGLLACKLIGWVWVIGIGNGDFRTLERELWCEFSVGFLIRAACDAWVEVKLQG